MLLGLKQPIWFYQQPIDFRKQIDGLALLVADQLNGNPSSGELFVFRNRQGNKLKLLWWDDHGFCLLYKRIEKGRFKFPAIVNCSGQVKIDTFLLDQNTYRKQINEDIERFVTGDSDGIQVKTLLKAKLGDLEQKIADRLRKYAPFVGG